jgi:hypothetical protein
MESEREGKGREGRGGEMGERYVCPGAQDYEASLLDG